MLATRSRCARVSVGGSESGTRALDGAVILTRRIIACLMSSLVVRQGKSELWQAARLPETVLRLAE